MIVGLVLVVIGAVALAVKLGVIQGSIWGFVWPVLLIALGAAILWPRKRWHFL